MTEKSDQSVLGNLPATRPTRFGRERRGEEGKAATATASKPKPAAKPRAKAAKPAARPRAAAADAAPQPAPPRRPRPVRAGAPSLADSTPSSRPAEPPPSSTSPPSGTELVTTAIQAAGELAQIGLAVGGQVLRRAVDKLPKP
jgi:hypothetical protein